MRWKLPPLRRTCRLVQQCKVEPAQATLVGDKRAVSTTTVVKCSYPSHRVAQASYKETGVSDSQSYIRVRGLEIQAMSAGEQTADRVHNREESSEQMH